MYRYKQKRTLEGFAEYLQGSYAEGESETIPIFIYGVEVPPPGEIVVGGVSGVSGIS